jgi:hypothetical protein
MEKSEARVGTQDPTGSLSQPLKSNPPKAHYLKDDQPEGKRKERKPLSLQKIFTRAGRRSNQMLPGICEFSVR